MSRLLRMDRSGHTELATWTEADDSAYRRAATIFREQLDGGYMGVAKLHDESFEQVAQQSHRLAQRIESPSDLFILSDGSLDKGALLLCNFAIDVCGEQFIGDATEIR